MKNAFLLLPLLVALASAQKPQTFTGTISDSMCARARPFQDEDGIQRRRVRHRLRRSHGAAYVLFDGKISYTLKGKTEPEKFAGQKVQVTRDARREDRAPSRSTRSTRRNRAARDPELAAARSRTHGFSGRFSVFVPRPPQLRGRSVLQAERPANAAREVRPERRVVGPGLRQVSERRVEHPALAPISATTTAGSRRPSGRAREAQAPSRFVRSVSRLSRTCTRSREKPIGALKLPGDERLSSGADAFQGAVANV